MKHLRSFFCGATGRSRLRGGGAVFRLWGIRSGAAAYHPGERGSIHATLTTPANAENMPAVVICHGFTGNRQLDGHAKPLAKTLAQHGIASIAIDFAGSGESEEPFTAYTPANMRDDITSAITYLTDTVGARPGAHRPAGPQHGRPRRQRLPERFHQAAALWAPADNTGLDGWNFWTTAPRAARLFITVPYRTACWTCPSGA